MNKLRIISINNYEYEFMDNENKIYKKNIEFYDLNEKPKVNDYIFMSEMLLNKNYEEYSEFYRFGELNGEHGRKLNLDNDIDVIGLKIGENLIYLQRYYG